MWPAAMDRSEVDLNLELYLRSVQIVVAAKLARDIEPQLALFDVLLNEAEYNGWGVAIGAGYFAIHFVWKFSASASKYLLYALNPYKNARLPDGSPLLTSDYPMEIMALMSCEQLQIRRRRRCMALDHQVVHTDATERSRELGVRGG